MGVGGGVVLSENANLFWIRRVPIYVYTLWGTGVPGKWILYVNVVEFIRYNFGGVAALFRLAELSERNNISPLIIIIVVYRELCRINDSFRRELREKKTKKCEERYLPYIQIGT